MATKWTSRLNMFRSARLSLTLFYLGIIVLFNLLVTLSVNVYAEREFIRSDVQQLSEVQHWVEHSIGIVGARPRRSDIALADIQDVQDALVRQRLNDGLLVINLLALGAGGLLSYWFAGRTLQPIQETHEAQARFTADASHEMRTPLANMRLENEIFLRQAHFTEQEARDQLASNLEEIQRLERLSNNLLSLHQYGQDVLVRSVIMVKRLANDSLDQLGATAAAKKVKVNVDIMPAKIVGHYDSLVQLICIVLDNAYKYGGHGGEVTVSGRKKNRRYILSISDKGPGIAPKDMTHIFDRLYRGDRSRSKVSGYGLGLALAKEIADANHAAIIVHNNPGGGACFEINLELAV